MFVSIFSVVLRPRGVNPVGGDPLIAVPFSINRSLCLHAPDLWFAGWPQPETLFKAIR
jgi:hypothetical protein